MLSNAPIDLMIAYCEGSISESDVHQLLEWRKLYSDHEQFFQSFERVWEITHSDSTSFQPPVEAALFKVHRRMHRRLFIRRVSQVAAILLVAFGVLAVFSRWSPEASYQQLVAEQQQTIYLPDSTRVTLAEGATIKYPVTFQGNIRPIELAGKAYFDVRHNAEKPFVITTRHTQTKVLGTRFTLVAKEGGQEALFLDEGRVSYSKKGWFGAHVLLEPGQEAVYTNGALTKSDQPHLNASSWATQQLVFKETPLREVAQELQEHYGVTIQLQPGRIGDLRFTGTLSHATAKEALRVVALTLQLNLSHDHQTFTLTL